MTPRRRRGTPPGPRRRPARPTLSLAEEEELEGQQGDKVGNLLGKSSKPRPRLPPFRQSLPRLRKWCGLLLRYNHARLLRYLLRLQRLLVLM